MDTITGAGRWMRDVIIICFVDHENAWRRIHRRDYDHSCYEEQPMVEPVIQDTNRPSIG